MRGVNKAIIVGRLGNDPVVKQFNNGGSVTHISVATSEQWTDKQTGEKKEATEWHRISLFNRLGEIAAQYLRKGSAVYIEGSLRTNKYTDQNGIERYSTEIRADNLQMLDSNNMGSNQVNNMNNNMNNGYPNQGGNGGGYQNHQPNQNNYNQNSNQYPNQNNYPANQGNQGFNGQNTGNQGNNQHANGQFGTPNNQQIPPNPFMNQNPAQPAADSNVVNTPKPGVVDDDVPFAALPF